MYSENTLLHWIDGVLETFLGTTMLLCILRILYFIGLMHGVLKTFLGTTMLLCILRILYFIGLMGYLRRS